MLTQDGDGGGEFSVSKEGLAVDLGVGVIWVRVTRGSLHPGPLADGAVPANDAVQNTAVVLQEQRHRHFRLPSCTLNCRLDSAAQGFLNSLPFPTSKSKTGEFDVICCGLLGVAGLVSSSSVWEVKLLAVI